MPAVTRRLGEHKKSTTDRSVSSFSQAFARSRPGGGLTLSADRVCQDPPPCLLAFHLLHSSGYSQASRPRSGPITFPTVEYAVCAKNLTPPYWESKVNPISACLLPSHMER